MNFFKACFKWSKIMFFMKVNLFGHLCRGSEILEHDVKLPKLIPATMTIPQTTIGEILKTYYNAF